MMEPVQSRVGSLSVIGMEQSVDIDGLVPVATARGAQDGEVTFTRNLEIHSKYFYHTEHIDRKQTED